MSGNIGGLECETSLREISVTGQSTGAAKSPTGEPADQPTVARLRPSVTSIATLTPDRLAGGFGVRIARKRSPIELSFLSPAVAPFDGEPADEPELSIVSPSPFARRDDRDDAFTYLTQSGRSNRVPQSGESVTSISESATQSPTARVFRSDRRSRSRQPQSSERTRQRGAVETTVDTRSDADTASTSRAVPRRTAARSGVVDADRPRQRNVEARPRRRDRRSRTVATRMRWADALTARTVPDTSTSDSRRLAASSDTGISERRFSSTIESFEREVPSRLVSERPVERAIPDAESAVQPDPASSGSSSSPPLVTRTIRPTDDPSVPDVPTSRDGVEPRVDAPSDTRISAATSTDTGTNASQPLQSSWIRSETRSRTHTVSNSRDSNASPVASSRRAESEPTHAGASPIRAASRPTAVRSDTAIDPSVDSNENRRRTEPEPPDRLERTEFRRATTRSRNGVVGREPKRNAALHDGPRDGQPTSRRSNTAASAIDSDTNSRARMGQSRHNDRTSDIATLAAASVNTPPRVSSQFDERIGSDSARGQPRSTGSRAVRSASVGTTRRQSGSDRNRAVEVRIGDSRARRSKRAHRYRSTPVTTVTDRIPRQSRVMSATTPSAIARHRAPLQRSPPLDRPTDSHGSQAEGRPEPGSRPTATGHRSTAYRDSIAGQPSPRSQRRIETGSTPVSRPPSPPRYRAEDPVTGELAVSRSRTEDTARGTAEATRSDRGRLSAEAGTGPSHPSTEARVNSGASYRRESTAAGIGNLSNGPDAGSEPVHPSRHDGSRSSQVATRIDSLRSIAATRVTAPGTDSTAVGRLPRRGSTAPRAIQSTVPRGPRLAVRGAEGSPRLRRGNEAAVHSTATVKSVRSSRSDYATVVALDTEPRPSFGDGQTRTRSLERRRANTASGATTDTPETLTPGRSPSGPPVSGTRRESASAVEPGVASESRRSEPTTAHRGRPSSNAPESTPRMPVLRPVSDRRSSSPPANPVVVSSPTPLRSMHRSRGVNPTVTVGVTESNWVAGAQPSDDSSRREPGQDVWNEDGRSRSWQPEAATEASDSPRRRRERVGETVHVPFRSADPTARSTVDSAAGSTPMAARSSPPSGSSPGAPRTSPQRGDQPPDIDDRVRERMDGATIRASSLTTLVSPSRASVNPRGTARSGSAASAPRADSESEFGARSMTLRYRSPTATDSTVSRLKQPRGDNSPTIAFDRGRASRASPGEANPRHGSSISSTLSTRSDMTIGGQNDSESASRDGARDRRDSETATRSPAFDSSAATAPPSLHRLSTGREIDSTPISSPLRSGSARESVDSDATPMTDSNATMTAGASGVAAPPAPRRARRTSLSVLRTTASRLSDHSRDQLDRQSVRTASSASAGSVTPSAQRPSQPPTVAVRGSPPERTDASQTSRDRVGAVDSRRERVGDPIDDGVGSDHADGTESATATSIRPSITDSTVGGSRWLESRLRTRRRLLPGRSATDGPPDGTGRGRNETSAPSLSLRTRNDVAEPTADASDPSASPARSRISNEGRRDKPTTNTIESTTGDTGANGVQTRGASDRPSLTYRRSSTTDAPTVDRGGSNRPTADSRGSTSASSGTSRGQTSNRAMSTPESGRERRGSSDRTDAGGDQMRSGFGSERRHEPDSDPALGTSPVGHDDVGSGPSGRQQSPADRPERPPGRRPKSARGHAPDSDRHSRNRFDSVDLSAGTDPRFDADVDRAVQELYRKLERKIRIERERRGL